MRPCATDPWIIGESRVRLAIFAGNLLLTQVGKHLLEPFSHGVGTALESAGLNRPVQGSQLIIWNANCNLL